MIYIINDSTNPYFNLALEEYVLKEFSEEAFILWRNKPVIVIGRNQNTLSEIDLEYVQEHNIDIVRRMSGGGAVFHDLGNINFTFITYKSQDRGSLSSGFEKFALPVIESLNSLGIDAAFSGRNDITIDDKKFSGNAQYHYKDKLLHHGTLLFQGNLERLAQALRSKPLKFQDKGVKSVKSRVTNISSYLREPMDVLEFKDYLRDYIMEYHNISQACELTQLDLQKIEKIQKDKFESWDWNYGKSPDYSFANAARYPAGTLETFFNISSGKIKDLKIFGDFFGNEPIALLEEILNGAEFEKEKILDILNEINLDEFIRGLEAKELVNVLVGDL